MRAFLAAGLLVLLACGGRVDSGDGKGPGGSATGDAEAGQGDETSSSSSGGSSSGTSSGVTVPLCPTDPPAPGTSCQAPGAQGCAYVGSGGCHSFLCDDSGHWQSTTLGC